MKTKNLTGVEVLRVGRWNGRSYSSSDLDNLVESYTALSASGVHSAPGKLGHNEEQPLTDGQPAVGWVSSVYRKGTVLLADFKEVPEKVAKLIEAGAYKKRSSEIFFNVDMGGKVWPAVLKAVAWLGADTPAVKGLDDIFEMYTDKDGKAVTIVTLEQEPSMDETRQAVFNALNAAYPYEVDEQGYPVPTAQDAPSPSIRDLFTDRVVVWNQTSSGLYQVPYTMSATGEAELGAPSKVRVVYETIGAKADPVEGEETPPEEGEETPPEEAQNKDKTTRYIVLLKDDKEEETEEDSSDTGPNLLKDMRSIIDRLDSEASGKKGVVAVRTYLKEVAKKLENMGFSDLVLNSADNNPEVVETMEDNELRALLGIAETDDIKTALLTLKATHVNLTDHEAVVARLSTLEAETKARKADELVDGAIKAGRLAPKQREWAHAYCLSDADGFSKYVEMAPKVVLLGEMGNSGESTDSNEASESALSIAAQLGVQSERLSEKRSLDVRLSEARAAKTA